MPYSTTALGSRTCERLREAVIRILSEARDGVELERRGEHRVPFFQPVLVGLEGQTPCFSAFSRDISLRGIGLLHIMPLACVEVVVRTRSRFGDPIDLRVHIEWCHDCGEGWYMTGGRLLDVVDFGGGWER